MYTRQRMRSEKSIHLSLTGGFSPSTVVNLLSFIINTYKFQFDLIQEVFVRNYVWQGCHLRSFSFLRNEFSEIL